MTSVEYQQQNNIQQRPINNAETPIRRSGGSSSESIMTSQNLSGNSAKAVNAQAGQSTNSNLNIKSNNRSNIGLKATGAAQLLKDAGKIAFDIISQMGEDCISLTDLTEEEFEAIKTLSTLNLVKFDAGSKSDILNKFKKLKKNNNKSYDTTSMQGVADWVKNRDNNFDISSFASDTTTSGLFFQALNTTNVMLETDGGNTEIDFLEEAVA